MEKITKETRDTKATESTGPQVKLSLFTNKEIQSLKTNLKILELEKRLETIQACIGDPSKISAFLIGTETVEEKLGEISQVVEFVKEDEPKYMYHKINLLKNELDKIHTRSAQEDAPPKIKPEDLAKVHLLLGLLVDSHLDF